MNSSITNHRKSTKNENRHRHSGSKNAAERALSEFKIYDDPSERRQPVGSPPSKGGQRHPSQRQVATSIISSPVEVSQPVVTQHAISKAFSKKMDSKDLAAKGSRYASELSSGDEARRCDEAKPVNALVVLRSNSRDQIARLEGQRALVRWRRQGPLRRFFRSLCRWLQSPSLRDLARDWIASSGFALVALCLLFAVLNVKRKIFEMRQTQAVSQGQALADGEKIKQHSATNKKSRRRTAPAQTGGSRPREGVAPSIRSEDEDKALEEAEQAPVELPSLPSVSDSAITKSSAEAPSAQRQPLAAAPNSSTNEKTAGIRYLARGTTIPVVLTAPVRSADATLAVCRVTSDVHAPNGQVVLQSGAIVHVPLSAPSSTGLFISDPDASGWTILPNGKTVSLRVTLQSIDGSFGLAGKLRKSGRLGKFLRGLAEAGATVGSEFETTREAARALREEFPGNGGGSNQRRPITEVKAGTRFWLTLQ